MKQNKMLVHSLTMLAVMALVMMICACVTISPEQLEARRIAAQERMLKGFQGDMDESLLDSAKALVDFDPAKGGMFAGHYWGLLFIRQIDDQPVVYNGYASSILGQYDNHFYLTPGEHRISKVRWQDRAEVGSEGSQWADDLAITYNFEAGKYYKLWAEVYQVDTGEKGIFGLPVLESKAGLVITPLN